MNTPEMMSSDSEPNTLDACEALLRSRHSVRRFRPAPIPDSLIRRLLDLAILAPSAHNAQPWRFAVATRHETRAQLARAMSADFARDMVSDGIPPDVVAQRVAWSKTTITNAPVVIVLCLSMVAMDVYPDPDRAAAERDLAVQSVALAGGHLLLAAHAAGLAGVWLCAPRFCPRTARQALDLPTGWEPQGLILLGYPEEEPRATSRESIEEVAIWR
ncbi:MAG: nitroreductase family protein [Anaerolineae bacterium]|nr:nitroreductase family protein [Anaerolineae bacterium]